MPFWIQQISAIGKNRSLSSVEISVSEETNCELVENARSASLTDEAICLSKKLCQLNDIIQISQN
jgi:hypothetical protein